MSKEEKKFRKTKIRGMIIIWTLRVLAVLLFFFDVTFIRALIQGFAK